MEVLAWCKKSSSRYDRICDVRYGLYNVQNVAKSGFGQSVSVCVYVCMYICVCVCVCLAVAFPANSHGRKGLTDRVKTLGVCSIIWGIASVPIFEAIRQPVY